MHAFAIALREIFTDRVFFAALAVAIASAALLYEVKGEDAVLTSLDADFRLFAVLIVAAVIFVLLAASPRERRLLLGDPSDRGLIPEDAPAKARAQALVMGGPGREPNDSS